MRSRLLDPSCANPALNHGWFLLQTWCTDRRKEAVVVAVVVDYHSCWWWWQWWWQWWWRLQFTIHCWLATACRSCGYIQQSSFWMEHCSPRLVLGFSTGQKSVDLEAATANATYDLTELILKYLLKVLYWAWKYCQCVDLFVLLPKLDSDWSY